MLVATSLCIAILACVNAPLPHGPRSAAALPAVALGQATLYRLEITLLVFYGALLLATPAVSGLIRGRLPIEISVRGARFAEDADQSADKTKAAIERLEHAADLYENELAAVHLKLDRLESETRRDITQPKVDFGP